MLITSRTNPKITAAASLSAKKKRDESGLFLIEGKKLFSEAVKRGVMIQTVFATEKAWDDISSLALPDGCEVYTVTESVYEKLSSDKSPDGIICTAKKTEDIPSAAPEGAPFILCDIQDAGNLGTCIRSALAMGISELILAGECADIYNPKTVRASMGALFSQRIIRFEDHTDAVKYCKDLGYTVYAAALTDKALPLTSVSAENAVFTVGNEGHGLPAATVSVCDGAVIIPMSGDSESLNASVAAAILMWESAKSHLKSDRM